MMLLILLTLSAITFVQVSYSVNCYATPHVFTFLIPLKEDEVLILYFLIRKDDDIFDEEVHCDDQ